MTPDDPLGWDLLPPFCRPRPEFAPRTLKVIPMPAKTYDSTVARMAGNIAAGWVGQHKAGQFLPEAVRLNLATEAVRLARAIIQEVERTQPSDPKP